MTKDSILEACKQIILAEKNLNEKVDKLLECLGITKEEATDGKIPKQTSA